MKGYKGFDKGLICRGKQYAENTVFEEKKAVICESGMHFCDLPHAVFEYYSPGENHEFAEVEALAETETNDDLKYTTTKLRVGAKISVFDLCKISVSAFFEKFGFADKISKVKAKKGAANAGDCGAANAGDRGAANAGDWGAANAGDWGAANAGDWGAANAGDCGAANAGNCGAANAGDCGAANAGNCGAANAGNCGAANAGYKGAANAGDWGAANAGDWGAANAGDRGAANAGDWGAANAGDWGVSVTLKDGKSSAGANGVAVARGENARVKGGLRSVLIIQTIGEDGNVDVVKVRTVDGKHIKANTWYRLQDGKFAECDDAADE